MGRNREWEGTKVYTEEEGFEVNDKYVVTGTITGYYHCVYIPGRMYMPNGDPGYPDEEGEDLTHFEIEDIKIWNEDGEEVNDYVMTSDEYERFQDYMNDKMEEQDCETE